MADTKSVDRRSLLKLAGTAGCACLVNETSAGADHIDSRPETSARGVLDRNKEQVRRFLLEGFNKRDLQVAAELVAPSFRALNKDEDVMGPAWVESRFKILEGAFSEHTITPLEMVAEGNSVAVRWHEDMLFRPGMPPDRGPGRHRVLADGASFYRLDDAGLFEGVYIIHTGGKIVTETAEEQD